MRGWDALRTEKKSVIEMQTLVCLHLMFLGGVSPRSRNGWQSCARDTDKTSGRGCRSRLSALAELIRHQNQELFVLGHCHSDTIPTVTSKYCGISNTD